MSFGRELKDFVSSFQAGYKMADGPEERDLKRARSEYLRNNLGKQARDEKSLAEADARIGRGGSTAATGPVAPPEEVKKIIDANVPENMREYAYKMAKGESGFDPSRVNEDSGAAGLFQFIPSTGKQYGIAGQAALDPAANTKAFVKFTEDNKATLSKLLGREPTWGELAVAHQQGAGGAWGLFTGRGTVKGKQAGNPKNASDIARYYGFDLNSQSTPTTTAAKPAPKRDSELGTPLPQKNMPDPNATPNRSAAIDGGFTGFGSTFDESPVQLAADGGAIEDPTAVSDEFAAKNNLTAQGRAELVGARKAAVSMAEQNGRAPELASNVGPRVNPDDYPLGNALDHGLKFIQQAFGLGQRPAVMGSDPKRTQNITAYTAGAGGSETDTQAAEKAVAGGRDIPRGQLVEQTVKEVGKKFKDDPAAAGRAVGTLLQTYRQRTMQAGQQAMKQVQGGDMIGALNTLKNAYDNVPDGNTVVFEPTQDGQGYVYKQLDGKGKVIEQGPVTMQALAQQAKLAAGGMAFDSMVVRAATPSKASPQAAREAVPTEPNAPAPAAPQAPQAQGTPPDQGGGATQQVTAQAPAGTASDATEEPVGPAATSAPAGRSYAIDDVEMEQPRPFTEPRPALVSDAGLTGAGLKKVQDHNWELNKQWEARKSEWDKNERSRVQKQFEVEKAAALQRDADARRALAAQSAADLEDKRNTVRDKRAQASAERAAVTSAEGRKDAERIRIAGEKRKEDAQRADETEKANPHWERNRRLAAEADPIDQHANEALQSGSMSLHRVGMGIKRQADSKRMAIADDATKPTEYAKESYAARSGPVTSTITDLMTEQVKRDGGKVDPATVTRYSSLADRIAQKNNTNPALIASLVYGMVTNRWSDGDQPRVQRDGTVVYGDQRFVIPPDVMYTIIAENGRNTGATDKRAIEKREADAAAAEETKRRNARDAATTDRIMSGAISAARGRADSIEQARRRQAAERSTNDPNSLTPAFRSQAIPTR